jgi:hypothetical protein
VTSTAVWFRRNAATIWIRRSYDSKHGTVDLKVTQEAGLALQDVSEKISYYGRGSGRVVRGRRSRDDPSRQREHPCGHWPKCGTCRDWCRISFGLVAKEADLTRIWYSVATSCAERISAVLNCRLAGNAPVPKATTVHVQIGPVVLALEPKLRYMKEIVLSLEDETTGLKRSSLSIEAQESILKLKPDRTIEVGPRTILPHAARPGLIEVMAATPRLLQLCKRQST